MGELKAGDIIEAKADIPGAPLVSGLSTCRIPEGTLFKIRYLMKSQDGRDSIAVIESPSAPTLAFDPKSIRTNFRVYRRID